MSRVHDALRRAESVGSPAEPPLAAVEAVRDPEASAHPVAVAPQVRASQDDGPLAEAISMPYRPAPESHLLDLNNSHETPAEEFRTLRTRLNHLQTLQPLHTLIVSSASPAEGKTFVSVNLALAQAQLSEQMVLLCDFDLRRPVIHNLFQMDRAPGVSDYLSGKCRFSEALRRVEGANLYVMPAGAPVKNPLELLNTRQARLMFEELPKHFNWSIFDTPPLLFSADANLLATMADGALLVVKIGATTFDNITRAMQSLCENNVVGIVANGARASELYSKYTYYYSKAE
jgi:protein-tyrosine kinase